MSDLNLLLSEREDFKIVKVQFTRNGKEYHYKTFQDVKEGDVAVVRAPSFDDDEAFTYDDNTMLKLVSILEVRPAIECNLVPNYNLKWLIDVVNIEAYSQAIEMEKQANRVINTAEIAKRRAETKENLTAVIGIPGVAKLMETLGLVKNKELDK